MVYTNTFFNPIALSWNLGGGLFVSAGFNFTAPTGTKGRGSFANFTPNPSYWTFEPSFAVSYLGNNWVASANFFYDINTASSGTCCVSGALNNGLTITSGNALYGDLMALYKFGKWSVGPVGYFEVQTTSDTGCDPRRRTCAANIRPLLSVRWLATTSARLTCKSGSPTSSWVRTRRRAEAASTSGRASASVSGAPKRRRRWLRSTKAGSRQIDRAPRETAGPFSFRPPQP